VYQFNPLSGTGVGGVFSYTNDASLLLPAHILGTSYVAMGGEGVAQRPTTTGTASIAFNGTVSIVGTQPNTVVTVRASARMRAGVGVAAMSKGEVRNFTLQPYDVLQLSTDVPSPATNRWFSFGYSDSLTRGLLPRAFCHPRKSASVT
jgi:hypothetical protein